MKAGAIIIPTQQFSNSNGIGLKSSSIHSDLKTEKRERQRETEREIA